MAYVNAMEWVGEAHNAAVRHVLDAIGVEHIGSATPDAIETAVDSYLRAAGVTAPARRPEISRAATAMLEELVSRLDKPSKLTALTTAVTALERRAARELKGQDLLVMQAAASVCRHSARLWAPKDAGNTVKPAMAAKIDWGKVVRADVAGLIKGGLDRAIRESVKEAIRQRI